MDLRAAGILHERLKSDSKFRDGLVGAKNCADFVLDPDSGLNVVFFTSGDGDGEYASYWGYDAVSDLACLVTDFGLLPCQGQYLSRFLMFE
jgi:hypothetical protein